jgi:HK97 family phage portal protein
MEINFSIRKSIKKHMSTSSHVASSNWSTRTLSEFYDFLHFRSSDHGSTQKFINSYGKNGLVYMVVNRVASNTSVLPREYQNENGEVIDNSEIEQLLKTPNKYQSETEFRQNINEYLMLSGNAFILNIAGIGAGNELHVLNSANVQILIDSVGDVAGYQYTDNVGKRIKYDNEEVLHIRLSNSLSSNKEEKFWGLSPLKSLWPVVSASDDLFTARSAIWKNRGMSGILTNRSDTPLLPKEKAELQESLDGEIGGAHKANGIKATTSNVDYIPLYMSPSDLQLLEGNVDNLRTISAGYEMPSVLFNDMASSTYNNVQEAKKSALTDAYIPLDIKVNEKLSSWLSKIIGVTEVIVVDISKIEILRLTTNDVAARLNDMNPNVSSRVMETLTVDEARNLVGLDTVEGGDEMLGKSNSKETDEKTTD